MDEKFSVTASDLPIKADEELNSKYSQLLGSLLFVSCSSRQDISLAVNKLARYATCATDKTYTGLKRVLRYLISTKDRGITWTCDPSFLKPTNHGRNELYAYVDAAYDDRAGDSTCNGLFTHTMDGCQIPPSFTCTPATT
eukprot:3466322-Rhodomonas_salina.1